MFEFLAFSEKDSINSRSKINLYWCFIKPINEQPLEHRIDFQ